MKSITSTFITFVIQAILSTILIAQVPQIQENPNNREDEKGFKEEREKWLESMHLAEPGINWRVLEQENKQARYAQHKQRIDEMLPGLYSNRESLLDVIIGASGLKGKWVEKGSHNQAGRIHTADIDFDNNIIYAASSGGNIWKGTINGDNWKCLNNGFQIGNIRMVKAIGSANSKKILVAGNGPAAFYTTTNDGIKWEKAKGLDGPASWGGITRSVVTLSGKIILLCNEWDYKAWKGVNSIYISKDDGASFNKIKTFDVSMNFCDIWAPKYDIDDAYFIQKDTVYKLVADTFKVQSITNPKIIADNISQTLMQGSVINGKIYLSLLLKSSSVDSSYIYLSSNLGSSFNYKGAVNQRTFEHNSFTVSHSDTNKAYIGGVEVFRTFNGGGKWEKVNSWGAYYGAPLTMLHADIPGIMNFRTKMGNEVYLIGTDGGLYLSNDDIKTVTNVSMSGLNVSQYYATYTHRKTGAVFAGAQDQGIQRCLSPNDGQLDFEQSWSGDYGHLTSSDGGNHVWMNYPGFSMIYINPQNQKFDFYTLSFPAGNGLWLAPIYADYYNPTQAFLISQGPRVNNNNTSLIWRLSLDSKKITYDSIPYNFNNKNDDSRISAFAQSPFTNLFYYALTTKGVFYVSSNQGNNWTENKDFKGPGSHYFYGSCLEASTQTPGKIYAAGSGYSNPACYMSNNHGLLFTPLDTNGVPKTLFYKIAVTPDDEFIFAATESGPYVYIAKEQKWYDMTSPDSPDQTYWWVEYIAETKTARFSTYGRGIWDFVISDFTSETNVVNNAKSNINIEVSPNPATTLADITVNSSISTNASINIYDLTGRMVAKLFNGDLSEGQNHFQWNCSSSDVTPLPAGNYLLTLTQNGKIDYHKIIIR